MLEVFLKVTDPKGFKTSMNDTGFPFFKNMYFRNANSLWKLVQLEQIEKHLKAKV